jgi:hypothetical protein
MVRFLLSLSLLFLIFSVSAQDSTRAVVNQTDVIDVLKVIYSKIPVKSHQTDTLSGQENERMFLVFPAPNYSAQTRLQISLASDFVFRLPNANISNLISNFSYTQNAQVILDFRSNFWTKNNALNLVGDYRIMRYPQSTYGLGMHTNTEKVIGMDYDYFRFYQKILKRVAPNFYIGPGVQIDYHWNIESFDETKKVTRISRYSEGIAGSSNSSGLSINFLFDNRKNSISANYGQIASLTYRVNSKVFGSNQSYQSVIFEARKYFKFPQNSENVLAFWSYNHLTFGGNAPFLDLPSTGWDMYSNTGRGFIQGRFRGKNWLYFESEYRFNLSRNRLIGGVLFANIQTVSEPTIKHQFNKIVPGFGTGLRVKLNKITGINFAADYGFGADGSHTITFNFGEVF